MKTARYVSIAFGILVGVGVQHSRDLLGQDAADATASAEWMRTADFNFSLSRREDVKRILMVRNIGVLEATLALEKLARKEFNKDDQEPIEAAKLLMMSGGGNPRALAALCNNITMKGGGGSEAVPLDEFPAAQALVAIGGRPARGAIFDSLRQNLGYRELLIRAHVLAQMEPRSVMREYIRLALEDQEEREKISAIPINETYKNNLRIIDEWLKNPQFLQNPQNWP